MERIEKEAEVKNLNDCFSRAQVAILGEYRGLTVGQITTLRRELRSKGAFGRVAKNTIARLSANDSYRKADPAQLSKFVDLLEGPNLLVFSYLDPVNPAKVLADFAKKNEKFKIKGGWFEGRFVDAKGIEDLSKMPSREELLANIIGLLAAPATQLVRLLQAPSGELVRTIDAHRANLEKKAA